MREKPGCGTIGCLAFVALFMAGAFSGETGEKLAALFLLALAMYGWFSLTSGSENNAPTAGYSTRRPLNSCSQCGHTWFPRGHDVSARCPRCKR